MKKRIFILMIGVFSLLVSCNSNSKSDTWNAEQEKKWKTECLQLLEANGVKETVAEDRCDCMFKKTSKKYTPEETAALTDAQEKEIWDECDYSW